MNMEMTGHTSSMSAFTKKTETLVGVFLFAGVVVLGGLILFFGNLSDWFKGQYEITVEFSEVSGIIKGSTVRLRGAPIGRVASKPILTGQSKVRVELAIEDRFQIAEGSLIQIGQASLLGDKEIVITPPEKSSGQFIKPGELIVGGGPSGLEFLQNQAEGIAADTRLLMQDARVALQKIDSSLDDFQELTIALKKGVDSINNGILNDQNIGHLSHSLENFERATAAIAKVADSVDPTVEEIEATVREFHEAARSARLAISKAEPALEKLPVVLSSIEETAQSATGAIEDLRNGPGVFGALAKDEELRKDLKDFVRNLKQKGILGYEDEAETQDPRNRFEGPRR